MSCSCSSSAEEHHSRSQQRPSCSIDLHHITHCIVLYRCFQCQYTRKDICGKQHLLCPVAACSVGVAQGLMFVDCVHWQRLRFVDSFSQFVTLYKFVCMYVCMSVPTCMRSYCCLLVLFCRHFVDGAVLSIWQLMLTHSCKAVKMLRAGGVGFLTWRWILATVSHSQMSAPYPRLQPLSTDTRLSRRSQFSSCYFGSYVPQFSVGYNSCWLGE